MRPIVISPEIQKKLLEKHSVSSREVEQCFENRTGDFLEDSREEHKTDPASLWFVAKTNQERVLKVVFVFLNGNIYIKTAFEPSESAIAFYDRNR